MEQIVHVQLNLQGGFVRYPKWWQNIYFVEIDVSQDAKTSRFSHFVHVKPSGDVCFMVDYQSNLDTTINILTPIRNQYHWLKYMLQMLSHIVQSTNETKVGESFNLAFSSWMP